MKKFLIIILAILLQTSVVMAKNNNFPINSDTGIKKGAISISVKDLKTGKTVKEYNSDIQISPASTLKILTYFSSIKTLEENYQFSTKLYKTKSGDYYIKLGADPYLTGKDLKNLVSNIKIDKNEELKHLYIDDTILDNITWGEGWQWDDSLNKLMPKFGSYNIDKNIYTVVVKPTVISAPANIFTNVFYPTTFINRTITSLSNNNVSIFKEDNDISPDALIVSGDVSKTTTLNIPIQYLRRYFILRLDDALRDNKISYIGKYEKIKVPANAELIAEITHPITNATTDILKNSNNLVAETVFKLAGGKYTNNVGSQASAMAMFNNYCSINKIDCSNIRITDGSGVSKNNLVTADFMTDFLITIAKNNDYEVIKKQLPTPGIEGTLLRRMLLLQNKLYAKTGTLSNISGITGYLDTEKGNSYAFAVYINDGNSSENSKKLMEDSIIQYIYRDKF